MPLSVVCGSFQPSLEKAFLERLSAAPPSLGRRIAVVTASRRMSERLQKLAAREGNLSLLNIRFHTLHSLALEAAEDHDWSEYTLISDDLFHDKLVDSLLEESEPGGGVPRRPRGLAPAYRASLKDLMEAGLDPVHFREHFPDLLKDDTDRTALGRLLDLHERYLSKLEELGVMPLTGLIQAATRHIEEGKPSRLSRYAEIFYYGFYDLNGVQSDFFSAVAKAHQTVLFFPYRQGHPAFRFVERFFQLKLHLGQAAPVHLAPADGERAVGTSLERLFDPSKPVPAVADEKSAALRQDILRLMAQKPLASLDTPRNTPTGARLTVFNVSGLHDEIWQVAKAILSLREQPDHPVDFSEIGVVARDLDPYRALLEEVFQENAIPYCMEADQPLLRRPIAKLCLSLLTLRRKDFPVTQVLDVVESPYFRSYAFQGVSAGADLTSRWRQLIRRVGVHSGWAQWKGKVSPWAKKDFPLSSPLNGSEPAERIPKEDSAALWLFLEEFHKRLDPAGGRRGWGQMVEYARTLLQEYFDVPEQDPEAGAWRETLTLLDSLKVFDRMSPSAGWDEFLEVFEEKLSRASLVESADRSGVRVLDAMDARGEGFRFLFLIGLKEGVFPRQIREDPLLRDSVRALLQQPAGYWILPKLAGFDEEKLIFALLVSSVSERLYCLYPRSNDEGRAETPSIYLRELCRATGFDLDSPQNERLPRSPYAKFDAVRSELLSPKEISLLIGRDRTEPSLFFDPMGFDAAFFRESLRRVGDMNKSGEPGVFDGLVGPPAPYLDRLGRKGLSPSAMDAAAACPFQFFLGRVMGLDPSDPSAESGALAPWAKGRLYHQILHKFYKDLWDTKYWSNPTPPLWIEILDRAVEDVFSKTSWQEAGVFPLLWFAARQQMTDHLRRFVERDMAGIRKNGMFPVYFETAYLASAPASDLKLQGVPDRIDWDPQNKKFRVVDYKTHWRGKTPEEMALAGKAHQLPVYLEAATQSPPFSTSRSEPFGAAILVIEADPVGGSDPWIHELSAEAWARMRAAFFSNVSRLHQRILRGQFVISPDEGRDGHCGRCAFSSACRKAHPQTRRRAEGVARAEDAVPAPAARREPELEEEKT